ncbi:MAG: ATP-grasp domain protein, partial [Candidatus Beckwithbacteria bacterium GW2011_GWA2_43_10]
RSGVWLGHDWNIRFSPEAQAGAEKLCQQWGDYLYQQGYKGVFGLDIIVDKNNRVFPIECNARYTGAFPMYTMMQLNNKEMPLDVWHLLEWLGVDYDMDFDEVQKFSRKPKQGAQLLLHNLERKTVTATKTVKAGVYKLNANKYLRPGFSLMDIKSEDEFVLCDRVAGEESVLKPAERLGRLVFKRQVVDKKGRLLPEIREVVRAVYDSFALMPVSGIM